VSWKPSNLSDIEARAWELIEKTPAPGKHAARNAFFHMERGYLLEKSDPEMALFRAITAEEEAITAIFHALQRRTYPYARKLDRWNHRQKAAVVHYFEAIAGLVRKAWVPKPQVSIEKVDGVDTVRVRFQVPSPEGPQWIAWMYPDPPLDFGLEIDGKRHDFRPEIDALLEEKSVAKFTALVNKRVEERNSLLYATAQGIPQAIGRVRETLDETNGRVRLELVVYLLVDTVKVHQQFVVQALDAFVHLMDLIPDDSLPER